MKKLFLFAIGATAMLASCSNEEDAQMVNDGDKVRVELNATTTPSVVATKSPIIGSSFETDTKVTVLGLAKNGAGDWTNDANHLFGNANGVTATVTSDGVVNFDGGQTYYYPTGANTSVEYTFPGDTGEIILRYLQHEKNQGRSEATIRCKRAALFRFNRYLIEDGIGFDDLGVDEIERYFHLTCGENLPLRHNNANHLRQLFHYLYKFGITEKNHALFVLKDQYRKQCKVPTTYSEEEISRIIAAVDRSSPVGKRDYLVLLLAAEYGWRAGDIISFKFNQIDWKKNTISFEQSKTDVPVEFPLLASVGNAIIDYLKYGRPDSEVPEVIVAAKGCTRGLPLASPTIHSIVSVNALLGCHDLALSCCHEIARISVMECSLWWGGCPPHHERNQSIHPCSASTLSADTMVQASAFFIRL